MKKLPVYLTYAGAIPFILCAACLVFDIKDLRLLGSVEGVLSTYSLIIVTFIAGSHWGQQFTLNNQWNYYLPIFSNVIAVVLWFSFLVLPFVPLLVVFVLTFFVLLFIDQRLFQQNMITRHYFQTRCVVTLIVVLMLLVSGMSR